MSSDSNEAAATKAELEKLRERLNRNSHGHLTQALRLQFFNDLATFVTAIGGVTAMSISAAFLGNAISDSGAAIVLTFVSGIITLIGVMQAVWKPGERSLRHQGWSATYASLENDCRLSARGLGTKSLHQILDEVSTISAQVDLVPEGIWRRGRHKQNS